MKLTGFSKTLDWSLIIAPILLLAFGTSVIYSLSGNAPKNIGISQLIFALVGIGAAALITFIDYRTWRGIAPALYGFGILSLLSVFLFGAETFGARRWIDFGFFQFQPSEIVKVIMIIVLAKFLEKNPIIRVKEILFIIGLIVVPVGLILLQPDLGSASVILFVSMVMVLSAKLPKAIIIAGIIGTLAIGFLGYDFLAPYQKQRVTTFINPNADPTGTGYNVLQSKIAVGSGGIWGRGLGQGSQSQLNFLPVAHTDFVFAGVAEATGFIGSVALLGLSLLIITRSVVVARLSQDSFGMYIALGLAALFLYQTFVNTGGNLGLVPITGIPYPFVSYGGTATIVMLGGAGLLQSIYLRHKKIRFY